jgi:pyruvate formate lyase activating enzyme
METVAPHHAVITNIQGFSLHDGPGIRTVVFFKGCPLSCRWCANPECLSRKPQMGFIETLCSRCEQCLQACADNAIRHQEAHHRIDYSRCRACGNCRDHCHYGAIIRYGESMTVDAVWDAIRRDRMFYESSGGGITVSGGEPLLWSAFIRELFELCRSEGIDTCMETCGFADPETLLEVLPSTDHILYDLKLMDSDAHEKYTGVSNEKILNNAGLVVERGADVIFRYPLIPGINDSLMNIEATAHFLAGLGENAARLEIMSYHRMGNNKYKSLDLHCPMEGTGMVVDEQAEMVKKAFTAHGINCSISR